MEPTNDPQYDQPTLQDHIYWLVYHAMCLFMTQLSLVSTAPTHRGMAQAVLAWVASLVLRWFIRPKTVTHRGTNRARRKVTMLIETNALPLNQTSTTATTAKLATSLQC